mmetsp:Transcript_3344/g.7926  ORF Transcript_3344/g.7926 Transcript_3344/m.7926 type:complete len:361 (+) Transcript_3344:97-1179(+)
MLKACVSEGVCLPSSRANLGAAARGRHAAMLRTGKSRCLQSAARQTAIKVRAMQVGNVGVNVRNTSNQRPVAEPNKEAFKISGRTVLVTGGSQGCGRATALLFAKKGFNVVIAARNETKCMYAAEDCARAAGRQGAALAVPTDVTDELSVKRLANEILTRYGTLDVVVSNAGVCMNGPVAETSLQDFKDMMASNFYGAVNLAHEFMPVLQMTAQVKNLVKPSFVAVNSMGGVMPLKYMSAYCASKYALNGFCECLRMEAEASGVHVGQVHPGVVNSNFMERAQFRGPRSGDERKQLQEILRSPVAQSPEEVAQAVWDCATGYRNEIIVGPVFATGVSLHRMTGINMTAVRSQAASSTRRN